MKESPRPKNLVTQVLPFLVIAAVPLAAFLAFLIQPMMGKRLLPIYGGTSGTWLGCMVYFQLALLIGYSWAAWLVRKPAKFQMIATVTLAVIAVVTFHLPSDEIADSASITRVVWRLSLASLPAMVLLFSTSPLLTGWLRRRGEDVPYYLYAISNGGSLLALLVYPFVIETNLGLGDQATFWHGALVITAGLLATAGYIYRNTTGGTDPVVSEPDEPLSAGMVALWLTLSALTCVAMLGATYHLAAEIGSNPIAWVGPFGLYLFSFMVTFSGRWQRWMTLTSIVVLAISLTWFMVVKGFMGVSVNYHTAWALLLLTASGSFLGNALLYSLRPAQRFERYYLVLAAGGVLGGLLSSTVIPYLFNRPIEFELAAAALLTIGLVWLTGRREPATVLILGTVLVVPILGIGLHQAYMESFEHGHMQHYRDLYGHVIVKTDSRSAVLSSDTTTHGSQLTADFASRHRPTLYFTESSGVGRTLERLQAARPSMSVGVIGLGAGTLAAYSRPGDVYDFYDIDPKSLRVAQENFTYIAEAAGKVNLILRDGRKALEDSKVNYDMIVIDAFTGDGVPSHLLTREAIAIYMKRLAAKDGILVVHASSRYSRYYPVVEATARSLGLTAINVRTEIKRDVTEKGKERDWDPTNTDYIIITKPEQTKEMATWFPDQEDGDRVTRLVTSVTSPLVNSQLIWTDDRNASIDVLDLGRYLFVP
ncbi:MAG: fused MFS/spermidine synthase [Opitutaceae bacterium]